MAANDYSSMIVVGTDGSAAAQAAVDFAASRAARLGKPLGVFACAGERPQIGVGAAAASATGYDPLAHYRDEVVATEALLASEVARITEAHPGLRTATVLAEGDAADHLAQISATADEVIVGSRGQSAPRRIRMLGGTSDGLVTGALGPIIVVPEGAETHPDGPVVVGVDESPEAREAIRLATAEAVARSVSLIALHTWSAGPWLAEDIEAAFTTDPEFQRRNDDKMGSVIDPYVDNYPELNVQKVVLPGHPAHALIQYSKTASLVVVGSRGRGGFAGLLLGSTSREVIRQAQCPVMVTRGPRAFLQEERPATVL